MLDVSRPCDSKSRNPNRYTRNELEILIKRHRIPLSDAQIRQMSLTKLCDFVRAYPERREKHKHMLRARKEKEERNRLLLEKEKEKEMKRRKALKEIRKEKELIAHLLAEKRRAREAKEAMAKKKKANETCEKRSLLPLRYYQSNVVQFMNTHSRLLVYHKMGTGKTLTAVVTSQCFLDAFPHCKVVVISPASLLDNFRKDMKKYGNIRHEKSYEFYSIQKCTNLLKKGELNCRNKMVIIDEVHNYKTDIRRDKNGAIISGRNIFEGYKCFLHAQKLLLLTGTPLYNNPMDLNLYKVLLNYNPETTLSLFDMIQKFKKEPLDILRCKLSYHDYEQDDADYPTRIHKDIKILMNPEYQREYYRILKEIANDSEKTLLPKVFSNYTESNENQFFNLTRRATQNIDNNLHLNRKLQYVKNLVDKYEKRNTSLPPKERYKIVIYSEFKDHGIGLIQNIIHVPYATISGNTKIKERSTLVNDYNAGNITVMFLTRAGGEGIDLKGTDAIVIMEPTWNESNTEQVVARAIRFRSHEGPRKKVKVYRLCHVADSDITTASKNFIRQYLRGVGLKPPKVTNLLEHLVSSDLIIEVYQRAKQKVLKRIENELEKLSIEKNNCQ